MKYFEILTEGTDRLVSLGVNFSSFEEAVSFVKSPFHKKPEWAKGQPPSYWITEKVINNLYDTAAAYIETIDPETVRNKALAKLTHEERKVLGL